MNIFYLVIQISTGDLVAVISSKSGVDIKAPVWTKRYEFREFLK